MTQKSAEEIRAWLMEQVAYMLAVSPDELDTFATFETYGLGSREAIGLSGDIEDWLGIRLAPSILYQYTTIDSLARHLATLEPKMPPAPVTGQGREKPEPLEHAEPGNRPEASPAALPARPEDV